ncbi:GntR family transcriptional regulator, partial [Streptomyces sp. NPDC056121]
MAAQRREPRKTRQGEAEASRPRESVRARVHTLLRARITSLELLPGAPLSENELAAELDVSRTPVREALILLGEESLVDVFPKLGTFVSRISVDAVLEAQFMREALELAALREAVTKSGAQDITALRAILDAQRAALKAGDADVFFEQDEAFHRRLMEASGHRTLWRTVATAKAHLDRA